MKFLTILLISVTAYAQQAPEWTEDSSRHVVNGDIVHWGTGEATTPEAALFKARHMAVKAFVEECGGIAHKDIIPRKQYVEPTASGHRAFALVSLGYLQCEDAKRGDKRVENPKLAEGQKIYDQLLLGQKTPSEIDQRIGDYLKAQGDSRDQENGELRNEIENLKTMIHQPVVQEPVTLPATDSQKKMCWLEYQGIEQELTAAAADYNGNMAAPELRTEFNRLERKRHLCQKLK